MKEASRLLVTLLLAATSSCITVAQDRHGAEALEPGVGVAVQLKRSELEGALEGPGGQQQQERDGAVATGYSLVEDTPRCYYGLGPKYCPAPGEQSARLHASGVSVLNVDAICVLVVMKDLARASSTSTCRRSSARRRFSPTWPGTRCHRVQCSPVAYGSFLTDGTAQESSVHDRAAAAACCPPAQG